MGTRFSLGHGFTIGRSGLRYGRSIPGLRRGYVSTGASGTLLTGAGVRHWEPARTRGHRNTLPAPATPSSSHRWTPGAVYTVLLGLLVVIGLIWAAYAQQAGFRRQDTALGLAAARAAAAPGICLADHPDPTGLGSVPRGHYSWTISTDGSCDPYQSQHFVAVGP